MNKYKYIYIYNYIYVYINILMERMYTCIFRLSVVTTHKTWCDLCHDWSPGSQDPRKTHDAGRCKKLKITSAGILRNNYGKSHRL